MIFFSLISERATSNTALVVPELPSVTVVLPIETIGAVSSSVIVQVACEFIMRIALGLGFDMVTLKVSSFSSILSPMI